MNVPIPGEIRAARAMLEWSWRDLANAAPVSVSEVKGFEEGQLEPESECAVGSMQDVLETEGLRFLADDGHGPGVRYKRR